MATSSIGELSNALVYELEELIESNGQGPGTLISHNIDTYANDFSAIISFALNCTASPSYTLTDRLLGNKRGLSTYISPRQAVAKVFDKDVYCTPNDEEYLVKFTKQLIGLERSTYLAVMGAIRTYVTGMHRLAEDYELAYTLLVASIESLAQTFDGHQSTWQDYDQNKRRIIDSALSEAGTDTTSKVRDAILSIEHTSLGRRFKDFSINHISKSFYREEAAGIESPISRYDLPKALANAYQARSQYIHKLRKLPNQLTTLNSHTETCRIDNKTWLTIQGLSRLARHVITDFMMNQPTVEKENYDYSLERSGIVQMKLAPEYWVHKIHFFHGAGSMKLEGFLSQLANRMTTGSAATLTDLTELLTALEKQIDKLKKEDKQAFTALYIIFNGLDSQEQKLKNSTSFIRRHQEQLIKPSSESLIVNLLFGVTPDWTLEEHHQCLVDYFKKRDNKLKFRCPTLFETGLILELAERYRLAGSLETAISLINMAVENHPAHVHLRNFEAKFLDEEKNINWRNILLPTEED
ncbi:MULTISPECIES: hypothetical protein [unclassified Vibrio]|uniref:hypothetical protein n=1 Tax=unclassified Vibrio TaxID=2614977 RepID=UPI0020A4FDB5|nr:MULTISPECIES: hypothetical protein [unclassified Vibrio]